MISQPSAVLALAILSFILTVIWGTPLIRLMKWIKVGDNIRIELSNKIQEKAGTPTMGGVMFVLPVLLLTVIINAVSLINPEIGGRSVMVPLFTMIAFAFLGGIDDWEKLKNKAAGEGMKARTKFLIQFLITLGIAYTLYAILDVPHLFIPGYPLEINLGWFYIPIAMFIIIGSANAVNFTDGFDGLAGLIAATCFAAYGGVALIQGQTFLAQFCFTLVGALFGFLWFNV
ncbi:MAG: phospho-N-acetylmuramoyl-pentapeptide-transferase, partial [Chloroflexi bacterium]|nr:phospho-N-acetylmuramoyl-pentapeptide-transferase [Chloroflexota bacterium]MBT6990050.1 phospho-N-acetylmuramoyl-pentapeptide-transferase [Chloroflexota bacterium]